MTNRLRLVIVIPVVAVIMMALGGSFALTPRLPSVHAAGKLVLPLTHQAFTSVDVPPVVENSSGPNAQSGARHPPSPICSTAASSAANVNIDCEGTNPHNETSIAVNPTNPLNMVGALNDYQLSVSSGGHLYETLYTRAHVTFDGGKTWTTYPIDFGSYDLAADPAVAFDADGTVYLATPGPKSRRAVSCRARAAAVGLPLHWQSRDDFPVGGRCRDAGESQPALGAAGQGGSPGGGPRHHRGL